jgi:hypothetical protein
LVRRTACGSAARAAERRGPAAACWAGRLYQAEARRHDTPGPRCCSMGRSLRFPETIETEGQGGLAVRSLPATARTERLHDTGARRRWLEGARRSSRVRRISPSGRAALLIIAGFVQGDAKSSWEGMGRHDVSENVSECGAKRTARNSRMARKAGRAKSAKNLENARIRFWSIGTCEDFCVVGTPGFEPGGKPHFS